MGHFRRFFYTFSLGGVQNAKIIFHGDFWGDFLAFFLQKSKKRFPQIQIPRSYTITMPISMLLAKTTQFNEKIVIIPLTTQLRRSDVALRSRCFSSHRSGPVKR